MAEIRYSRADSSGSAKVTPLSDETIPTAIEGDGRIITSSVGRMSIDGSGGDEISGEHNPHDAWLPLTESRNGTTMSATFHLFCSGIGIQVLALPMAFVSLGWFWGIVCLSLVFAWQLYTIWLLVNLHESAPITGIRYSRFLHLSIVAFGEKLGKLLAIFPTMYLSGGACVLYIITGGATMESFFLSICDNNTKCTAKTLTGAEWFLLFIILAIFIAQFFPNLNSLSSVALIGSITALAYCTLLWILVIIKGRPDDPVDAHVDAPRIRSVFTGIEIIALAFRGHNLVLEIQGTLPSNQKQPSHKSMWRGVIISYIVIAMCMCPLAIAGYWAYGDRITSNGGILNAFAKYNQSSTSKYITAAIYLTITINYLCAFQIYAVPTLDNFSRIYVGRRNQACPRWVRSAMKVFFGGLTYFVAVGLPFLPKLGAFIGGIALPLTLVYPCFMWVAIKKPKQYSRMWCVNLGLGSSGAVLCVMFFGAALWSLIDDGLEANFFKPK